MEIQILEGFFPQNKGIKGIAGQKFFRLNCEISRMRIQKKRAEILCHLWTEMKGHLNKLI